MDERHYRRLIEEAARAQSAGHVSGLDFVGIPGYPDVSGFPPYPSGGTVHGLDFVGQAAKQAAMMPYAHHVQIPPAGVYSTQDAARVPRRKPAGFPLVTIAIGAVTPAVPAQLIPQEAIRPERLVIVDASGVGLDDVFIDDIKVGARSQNVGTGPIPAGAFATVAFDTLLESNTINPGITVLVALRLAAPAVVARTFSLAIIGRSAEV